MNWKSITALTASLLLASVTAAAAPPDAAYQKDYDKWKVELADDLKQNWLPLAGLFWLKPGENSFGTDDSNTLVFPRGPAHAGAFELQGKDVTMKVTADAHAIVAGKAVTTTKLIPTPLKIPRPSSWAVCVFMSSYAENASAFG